MRSGEIEVDHPFKPELTIEIHNGVHLEARIEELRSMIGREAG